MNLQVEKEKKEEVKMNVSKVGNQTSSQDPQAVNSRSTFFQTTKVWCSNVSWDPAGVLGTLLNFHFQGFCWEPEHVPDSED